MKKFMLFFVDRQLKETEDTETQAFMKKWGEWIADLASKGVVETGSPFDQGGKVVKKDLVSDYQPQEVDIGGYMIVNAPSLEKAVEISKQAPHMSLGGTTIVRPCMDMRM